jgi:hypothetical protein
MRLFAIQVAVVTILALVAAAVVFRSRAASEILVFARRLAVGWVLLVVIVGLAAVLAQEC